MESNTQLAFLKRRCDFSRIFKNGHKFRPSRWMIINFMPNSQNQLRCGWTLPKKVGSAVVRNRLRRWCREYFRQLAQKNGHRSLDINVVFLGQELLFFSQLRHQDLERVLDRGWRHIVGRTRRLL